MPIGIVFARNAAAAAAAAAAGRKKLARAAPSVAVFHDRFPTRASLLAASLLPVVKLDCPRKLSILDAASRYRCSRDASSYPGDFERSLRLRRGKCCPRDCTGRVVWLVKFATKKKICNFTVYSATSFFVNVFCFDFGGRLHYLLMGRPIAKLEHQVIPQGYSVWQHSNQRGSSMGNYLSDAI